VTAAPLLRAALSAAVPLWATELESMPYSYICERANECSSCIAEHGDVILYRGRKGESAAAFNRLAEGLACLSFAPGGVRFLDMHFDFTHPELPK
jgi:hypothetical protein